MGLKKIFRCLACRPVKDEENQLNVDLMQAEPEQQPSTKEQKRSNNGKPVRSKKRNTKKKNEEELSRYMLELRQTDPFAVKEVTGKYVDIIATFSPQPKWWVTIIKLIIFVWITFISVDGFLRQNRLSFYLATFDHWSNIVTIAYLWFSFLVNFIRPSSKALDFFSASRNIPSVWHKITWALFAVAAPSQLFSSLAFWCFENDGSDLDGSLVTYCSVLLLLLVEGLGVNRTPLRINHQWFFIAFVYAFLLWSLIHSYSGLGNPNRRNGEETLYTFLDWNGAPVATALNVMIILLLVLPSVYWVVWMMSLFSFPWKFQGKSRRYLNQERSQMMESYLKDLNG